MPGIAGHDRHMDPARRDTKEVLGIIYLGIPDYQSRSANYKVQDDWEIIASHPNLPGLSGDSFQCQEQHNVDAFPLGWWETDGGRTLVQGAPPAGPRQQAAGAERRTAGEWSLAPALLLQGLSPGAFSCHCPLCCPAVSTSPFTAKLGTPWFRYSCELNTDESYIRECGADSADSQ